MQLEKMIEKRRALLEEIQQAKLKLHHLPYLDGIQRERWDAHTRMESIMSRYGTNKEAWPGHIPAEYNKAKATVESADSKVKAAKEKKAQIDARLEYLQTQFDALYQQISVEDLLPMQTTVTDLSQKIENLKVLVAEEEGCVAEDEPGNNHPLVQLNKEKEDLLAAIACGESSDEECLAVLSQEISKEEELQDNHVNALITSSQKIAGLNRKIKQVGQELALAQRNYLDGLTMFLDQELEKAGGNYVKDAGNLAAAYSKVIALAAILEKCGMTKNVFGTYTRKFKIPSFLLDTCMAHEISDKTGVLFQFDGGDVQKKIDAEIERIGRLGINIPVGITAPL